MVTKIVPGLALVLAALLTLSTGAMLSPMAQQPEGQKRLEMARCDLARHELQMQRDGVNSSSFAPAALNRLILARCT